MGLWKKQRAIEGLVLRHVQCVDEAVGYYAEARRIGPDNPEIIGNLARCRLRNGQRDEPTRALLRELLLKDTRPKWVEWARMELMRMFSAPLGETATQPADGAAGPARQPGQ